MQEIQEKWVQFLGQEDPLEKRMATHSNILSEESHRQRRLADYGPCGVYVYIYVCMYVLYTHTHTHTHTYNTVYNELSCTIVGADKSRDLKLARWTQKICWCAFKSKSESLRSKRANDINSSVKAGKLKIQYETMFHLDPEGRKKTGVPA